METTPKLLEYFPPNYRGHAGNIILQILRSGVSVEFQVDLLIRKEIMRRSKYPLTVAFQIYSDLIKKPEWESLLYEAVQYYIEWEKKDLAEKSKVKKQRGKIWIEMYMKEKEPTDKQIAFLRSKGVSPLPTNRLEASKIIDQIINSK